MAPTLFPCISRSYIQSCQFSSWYPTFSSITPRATVVRPLSHEFRAYLEEDGVMVPEGSEDIPASSSLSDDSSSDDENSEDPQPKHHAFPELDAQIRDAIKRYGAVFPKLNWTSPKDASWVLPTLKCTSPADVYLLLKSSDFVSHDLDPSLAFEGCTSSTIDCTSPTASEQPAVPTYELELVLKKWYSMDPGREFRCFVRDETLLAITQRDPNYYPHLNTQAMKDMIVQTVAKFWTQSVRTKFSGGGDYVFDVHLTRDLSSAHILDFNPYHPKTDPLLFTHNELLEILVSASSSHPSAPPITSDIAPGFLDTQSFMPVLRTITSPSHPAASRNAPINQHNAVPFDALHMSTGKDIATFSRKWTDEITGNLDENSDDE